MYGPDPEPVALDPTDEDQVTLQKRREVMETRNPGYVVEVCQWILCLDPSAAFVRDGHGMNPFHYAISKGKQWNACLKELARLVPEWPQFRATGTGLYPFMLAAATEYSDDDDVSTIYGLLRFDGSTLQRAIS
jgi:hypothetical protein